jgi:hypothetical protein
MVDSDETVHIRRYLNDVGYDSKAGTDTRILNPNYSNESTAIKVKNFIDSCDYLFAYEPKGCDRNRLKELFDKHNLLWYPSIQQKLKDFNRDCINRNYL